jgi:glutamyl-tRNA synthetase
VVFSNDELDDLIIARSDGTPTYNFTVVVDDSDMRISHVIRGDDHLNNTPKQMNMLAALGVEPPAYAHLPMILGADGAKLSKRHGAVDVREYRDLGYLPRALLNYLVRLGWSHGDQEIFSIDDMIRLFDIADVNQSASAFNAEKLAWLNQQHIIATPPEVLGREVVPYFSALGLDPEQGPEPAALAAGFHERAATLLAMVAGARYCYEDFAEIEPKSARKNLRPVILAPLQEVRNRLAQLSVWNKDEIAKAIDDTAAKFDISMGKLGQPIRVAVTGGPVSPPIDITLELVGRNRTIKRLDQAIEKVREWAAE